MKPLLASLHRFLDQQVSATVGDDPAERAAHRDFLAVRIATGLLGLLAFPIWMLVGGPATVMAALTLAWLLAPLPIALWLSRSGRLQAAHLAAAAVAAGLAVWLALQTGGLASPFLVWLAFGPVEAALSADRRTVLATTAIAGVGAVVVAVAGPLMPPAVPPAAAPAAALGALALMLALGLRLVGQRRLLAAARDDAEARYALLADNAGDLVTRHGADRKVASATPAARALLGVRAADLVGDGLLGRVHVADRPAYLTALDAALGDRREATAIVRLRAAGDGFVWAEMRCRPAGAAAVAVFRDAGERVAREAELARAREEAEAAGAAKTRFLASVTHELRTPLNSILGFSDLLGRPEALPAGRAREYAGLIHGAGTHLLGLVNEVLDLSRLEAGEFRIVPEPVDLAALVADCCALLLPQAEARSVTLAADLEGRLPTLHADPRACRQILLNLLGNAVKFSRTGGRVVIAARRCGGEVALTVGDTGIGIAAADLPRLGTPFVQADSAYNRQHGGTGLGLAVVKGLAALHGGSFAIRSELGVGTEVTVTLPATASVAALRLAGGSGSWSDAQQRKRA